MAWPTSLGVSSAHGSRLEQVDSPMDCRQGQSLAEQLLLTLEGGGQGDPTESIGTEDCAGKQQSVGARLGRRPVRWNNGGGA